jgi:transmembrane sensor
MKGTDNINKYTDKEWEDLSSLLSGEDNKNGDLLDRFTAEDRLNTIKYWKELGEMNSEKEIDVDKAWKNLYSRLSGDGLMPGTKVIRRSFMKTMYFRIAATLLLLLGLGTLFFVMNEKDMLSRKVTVATTETRKNLQVTLPDGSIVVLNRKTTLAYHRNFVKHGRYVTLKGEAFFDITPDSENPFTINAGNASIKVVGTTFNVITSNADSAVEVFVKTGKVIVTDNEGTRNIVVDPGYVGTMSSRSSEKHLNEDQNYMAWNSGILVYDGQPLDVVLKDLRRVYNMDVVADDPEILKNTWTTNGPLDNQPEETIIRLICLSFNLGYSKDGSVYHLSKK